MAKELGPRARERALAVAADVARRIQAQVVKSCMRVTVSCTLAVASCSAMHEVELTQSAESVELPPMRGKSVQNLRKLNLGFDSRD